MTFFAQPPKEKQVEKVAIVGITKEAGFLYFVDKDGDISKSAMVKGRKKKNA